MVPAVGLRRGISSVGRARLWLLPVIVLAACGGGSKSHATTGAHQHAEKGSPAVTSSTTTSTAKPVSLTVEVNGDLLIHSPVWEQALADGHGTYDFSPMLAEISPFIKHADLAISHV